MMIKNDGKVGIGTHTPGDKLEVAGGTIISGSLTANNLYLNTGIYSSTIGNANIPLSSNYSITYTLGSEVTTTGSLFNGTTSANIFTYNFTNLTTGNYQLKCNVISKYTFYYKFVYDIS
jgi:hypothetical protein